jgi:ubiquinone/menaquinone biosynthesis C-methylase UbiE/cell division protein FtsB
LEYWQRQYQLAKQNNEHSLPEDCMRMPSNELHQLMAKEFWQEAPKDFETILDVGCSDGYMVKVFKDSGKDAVGINDFLYPTDKLFIEEYSLEVYEMDMHCMDFEDESFDAVWCRHTLEHSFAPLQVLYEIYRVTKKNGYLFVVLPPPPDSQEPYEGHWHQIPQYQLEYLLKMCGFEIISIRTAWFSYKRESDNLEIRAICKKDAHDQFLDDSRAARVFGITGAQASGRKVLKERSGDIMDEMQVVDVEKIMQQIRKDISARRPEFSPAKSDVLPPDGQVANDIASLHSGYDIYHIRFASHRKALGWLVILLKKMLRRLLTPILERQLAYNAANTRVASHLWQQVERMSQQHAMVRAELEALRQQQMALQTELTALRQQAEALQRLVEEVKRPAR